MSETPPASNPKDDLAETAQASLEPLVSGVEATFAELGQSIVEELDRASISGRQSINDLVNGMLEDLAQLAAQELIGNPIKRALGGGQGEESSFFRSIIRRSIRNG